MCQQDFLRSQVPWIVKTDDDMINNIWKLGALVEALKFQRWQESSGWGCRHKLFSGTQSLARLRRNGWSGLKVAEGLTNGWSFNTLRQKMERKHFVCRWFHSTSGPTSSFQRTAGALSTSWASLWGINWYRSEYGSVTIGLWKLLAGIPSGCLTS